MSEPAREYSEEGLPCPVCKSPARRRVREAADQYLCPRCGRFDITGTAEAMLNASPLVGQQLANASGWIREQGRILIHSNDLPMLQTLATPSVSERARKALRALAKRLPAIGQRIDLVFYKLPSDWLAITWSQSEVEVEYLFTEVLQTRSLIGGDYIDGMADPGELTDAYITPSGHEELDRLETSNQESSLGFCAMWFDKSLDIVWTEAISPGITDAGYDAKRIDNVEHNNKIDDEIIATIRRSRFVVADFTGQRGGVYFEAGFAIGLSLPVVWTVRSDDLGKIHFDNRQYNFIEWSLDNLPAFRKRLKDRIEATIGKGPTKK